MVKLTVMTSETVWTQIRPDKMLGLIWLQTVWHFDGIPERLFEKVYLKKKNLQITKKHAKLPSMQRVKCFLFFLTHDKKIWFGILGKLTLMPKIRLFADEYAASTSDLTSAYNKLMHKVCHKLLCFDTWLPIILQGRRLQAPVCWYTYQLMSTESMCFFTWIPITELRSMPQAPVLLTNYWV